MFVVFSLLSLTGLLIIVVTILMFDSRPEDLKRRGLKKTVDTLLTENDELREKNAELTDLVMQYKIKLEAKELGLPFPSIEEEERQLARVFKNVEKSMQDKVNNGSQE